MARALKHPRDYFDARGRLHTPFTPFIRQERSFSFLGLSLSPRSFVCFRLGEGSIRSLLFAVCLMMQLLHPAFAGAQAASGQEGVSIKIQDEALVASNRVYLEDVAEISGGDSETAARLAKTPIGNAPEFGNASVLTRRQIWEIVDSQKLSIPEKAFSGAPAVRIRLKGRTIESDEIARLIKENIAKTTSWKESEITIGAIDNLKGIELPLSNFELKLQSNVTISGPKRVMAAIEARRMGKSLKCFWVAAEVNIHASVLTAAQKITRGESISSGKCKPIVIEVPDLRSGYARNEKDVEGKMSRRSFSPGDPLAVAAFIDPLLIKSGDKVKLRLEKNGILLTSFARAEQDGVLGQIIKVRNLDFMSSVKAIVTGRAEVQMQ
jgi:flagella basal body P-ring formation protein FlgA